MALSLVPFGTSQSLRQGWFAAQLSARPQTLVLESHSEVSGIKILQRSSVTNVRVYRHRELNMSNKAFNERHSNRIR